MKDKLIYILFGQYSIDLNKHHAYMVAKKNYLRVYIKTLSARRAIFCKYRPGVFKCMERLAFYWMLFVKFMMVCLAKRTFFKFYRGFTHIGFRLIYISIISVFVFTIYYKYCLDLRDYLFDICPDPYVFRQGYLAVNYGYDGFMTYVTLFVTISIFWLQIVPLFCFKCMSRAFKRENELFAGHGETWRTRDGMYPWMYHAGFYFALLEWYLCEKNGIMYHISGIALWFNTGKFVGLPSMPNIVVMVL